MYNNFGTYLQGQVLLTFAKNTVKLEILYTSGNHAAGRGIFSEHGHLNLSSLWYKLIYIT